MEEEFVADSEGEGGLEFSPPGYGHPMPLDASFDHFQVQTGQPGPAIYSPSTISEFPSTLQTTAKQPFDSPIVDFTATTHSSIVKKTPSNRKSKAATVEIVDLSSEEERYVAAKPRKPPRQKAASPSESAYGEPVKPSVKARKKSDAHDGDIPAKDKARKGKKKLERANSDDDIISLNEPEDDIPTRKAPKKRKSNAKKKLDDDEESISEAPKVPSKKRKSPDNDDLPVGKPSKKRKKNSPKIGNVDNKAEDHIRKKTQKKGRQLAHVSDAESEDELLLTKDTPVEAKKFKSSALRPTTKSESIPPEDNSAIVSAEDSSVPSPHIQQGRSESPPPPSEPSTSMLPPPPQPAKVAPRLSTEARPTYGILKRGSISDLLRKTGLHTPLSSSKLTKKAGDRIAPLHAIRTTPPPPPPPIPKPKKKVVDVDEDEDDFTGMTEKQIAKFLEEKKKKAWYSP